MAAIDKLLKYSNSKNVAEFLDEEKQKEIADDVILGYKIDDDSRKEWLEINKEAVSLIKHCEGNEDDRDFPFIDSSKVSFPLLAPAIIQLASRMITHITRNNKAVDCAVLGEDTPLMDANSGQPVPGKFTKQERAKRVGDFLSYEVLIESDTWLKDDHKLCGIVAGWGTGFKRVYYDYILKKSCSDVMSPEDVIVNHNITSLEKAQRVTTRHYLTKNELVENIRAGYFLDIDLEKLDSEKEMEGGSYENDSREKQPVHEMLCQTCFIDLDDDGYLEPYKCYVHLKSKKLLCIIPAFDVRDIDFDENKGEILSIRRRLDVVDRHLIDDPEGKFYSIGLNYLLLHTNKSITSILRQLIDAGTLSNAAAVTGFVTKAFKTKERTIRMKMGSFEVLDCNSTVDPSKQFIPMPFREPSQVLLGLLQVLIQSGKENGYITDVLTGDVEMQNVPATTALAAVEQGTRAFKPIIEKLYISLKKEFKIRFYLNSKHLEQTKYVRFFDNVLAVSKEDFDEQSLDICPVADPTQSSEAHKYAKLRALVDTLQILGPVTNLQEVALRFYTGLEFENPERLIAPPQPQQPDPKLLKVQVDAQLGQMKQQVEQMKIQLEASKIENDKMKLSLKSREIDIKAGESDEKQMKMKADAMKDRAEANIKGKMASVAQQKVAVESRKVEVMRQQKKSGE